MDFDNQNNSNNNQTSNPDDLDQTQADFPVSDNKPNDIPVNKFEEDISEGKLEDEEVLSNNVLPELNSFPEPEIINPQDLTKNEDQKELSNEELDVPKKTNDNLPVAEFKTEKTSGTTNALKVFLTILPIFLLASLAFAYFLTKQSMTQVSSPETFVVAPIPDTATLTNVSGCDYTKEYNPDDAKTCHKALNDGEKKCTLTMTSSELKCENDIENSVYRFQCTGKTKHCDGSYLDEGGLEPHLQTVGKFQSVGEVDCGETVQIDVFDKNCMETGTWSCGTPIDYFVWYTGACPDSTPTPTPTSTPIPTPTPTSTPIDEPISCNSIEIYKTDDPDKNPVSNFSPGDKLTAIVTANNATKYIFKYKQADTSWRILTNEGQNPCNGTSNSCNFTVPEDHNENTFEIATNVFNSACDKVCVNYDGNGKLYAVNNCDDSNVNPNNPLSSCTNNCRVALNKIDDPLTCLSLEPSGTESRGEILTFTCNGLGATLARFRILLNGNTNNPILLKDTSNENDKGIEFIQGSGKNVSAKLVYTIPEDADSGNYKVQCRFCNTTTCTNWGEVNLYNN